jgi:lipopolysaccharide/colanic/teichoic acid biosynthesis glycosyltransferase
MNTTLATPQPDSTECVSTSKRCFDFVVAVLALLFLWPLIIAVAVLIRLQSQGPVIFRQRRVGQGGMLFVLFKFRTMELSPKQDGPFLTKRGDPRITKAGLFLRKYKLDELPQLFNVLSGDMSLIGPRPKLQCLEWMDMPFRPGLTGAATLAFRGEEEMLQDIPDHELESYYCRLIKPLKVKLDWDYMAQATLASDIALLCETAVCCLSSRPSPLLGDVLTIGRLS